MTAPASTLPATSQDRAQLRLPLLRTERQRVGALLAVLAILLGASMASESPTTDEPLHLTRGLAYFWGPDTSLSYSHPPLGNAFAALPIALTAPRVDVGALPGYAAGEAWTVSKNLLGSHYGRRRPWFFEARAMIALSCVALAFYVYRLAASLFGSRVALWALAFYALHPTLIAHGRLDTTDFPVTVAMVIAVGELVRFLRGDSRWHGVAAAFAVGAAMVTKYTGLLMVPLASCAVIAVASLRLGRYQQLSRGRALAAGAVYLSLSAAAALFVIDAAYRFERTGLTAAEMLSLPEPASGEGRGFGGDALERASILPKLPGGLPIPLPYTYVFGLAVLRAHDGVGHPTTFLGRTMRHGHPAYFPVMLLIKTPLALLIALGCAAYFALRRRGRLSLASWLLAGYALGLLLLAMRASINIGVRHVLPLMPVLCVLGALGAVQLLRALEQRSAQLARRVALIALLGSIAGAAWSFPDYLSDFNLLVAGRLGGERISIVGEEWGQDTLRLGRALRERGVRQVYFSGDSVTSRLELARLQVTSKRLGCPKLLPSNAYVAIQARDLARHGDGCRRWAKQREPAFSIGAHVFVYQTGPNEQPF
ncbi:MAG TPA: glycosyltransferase family 39 protein [Polyangiales bacterium]|nr:glycosyltransferase family 39 protein [Polyangiales bacterium]